MAKRFYFCSFIGAGIDNDPLRIWFVDKQIPMKWIDMRPYQQIADGYAVVWGEIADANHTLALVDPSVTYLPFEDAAGVVQPLTATLNKVSAANRTKIQTEFTARGIPISGIVLTWTIAQVLQLMRRRMVIGLLLENCDFDDMQGLVGSMSALKLKALRRSLVNHGFDDSGITAGMTQAEAIANLADQPVVNTYIDNLPGLAL